MSSWGDASYIGLDRIRLYSPDGVMIGVDVHKVMATFRIDNAYHSMTDSLQLITMIHHRIMKWFSSSLSTPFKSSLGIRMPILCQRHQTKRWKARPPYHRQAFQSRLQWPYRFLHSINSSVLVSTYFLSEFLSRTARNYELYLHRVWPTGRVGMHESKFCDVFRCYHHHSSSFIIIIYHHHSSSFIIIHHHSSSFIIIHHHSSSFIIIHPLIIHHHSSSFIIIHHHSSSFIIHHHHDFMSISF